MVQTRARAAAAAASGIQAGAQAAWNYWEAQAAAEAAAAAAEFTIGGYLFAGGVAGVAGITAAATYVPGDANTRYATGKKVNGLLALPMGKG